VSRNEYMTYMGYQWLLPEDDQLTIGINEEGLDEIGEITKVMLPSEGDKVRADEIFGEIETDEGPLNIYSPVDGKIVEVNSAVLESPELIMEDSFGDGWLVRIEMNDPEDIHGIGKDDDDEDDEDFDDEDEDEDSDEDEE
jgi:glycine cleavage system H protein